MKISRQARILAQELDLSEVDAAMMELKSKLYERCSHSIKNSNMTHENIAKLTGTSRARVTRLANMGENSVSLELLIKISAILEEKLPIKVA